MWRSRTKLPVIAAFHLHETTFPFTSHGFTDVRKPMDQILLISTVVFHTRLPLHRQYYPIFFFSPLRQLVLGHHCATDCDNKYMLQNVWMIPDSLQLFDWIEHELNARRMQIFYATSIRFICYIKWLKNLQFILEIFPAVLLRNLIWSETVRSKYLFLRRKIISKKSIIYWRKLWKLSRMYTCKHSFWI